ncbi:MAG: aldo/keto reductase [Oscillospiraceae bacterium]|jgi:predicted aldo/keto reductase-like oxidoreductase|nr:aldo/keto reductase [Oscillospiraceae bacterium]
MAYLGQDIPKLGFGLMRLPTTADGGIDIPQTSEMVDIFLANGFKYFDTAYGYSNGESEKAIKKALVERYPRDSYYLATKLPAWDAAVTTAEEARNLTVTSLERTGAGYFDFYLLHNLGQNRTAKFEEYKIWDYARELKEKGLVKHWGFSFHDSAELLDKILTEHPDPEFIQLQINWADWDAPNVQSRDCLEVAAKHNKPVVIMEPVKGGMLAAPAQSIRDVFDAFGGGKSYSSWAIRFAASQPNVITVLSGMSNVEQMRDNTSYMKDFKPLSEAELEVIEKARAALKKIPSVPCTACKYCVPGCPQNIQIPDIFDAMNREIVFGDKQSAKFGYTWGTNGSGKASDCVRCGSCERVCPQKIRIPDVLREAAAKYE